MAVARSSTFSLGDDQKASWPTRLRLRWVATASASAAASPPIRRNSSFMTGPYSIQWPSASMTGWRRRS